MNIHFIKSNEKRKIIEHLNQQFGIENLPYLLIESGKEKIRVFSGSLSKEEIKEISRIANIEVLGLYMIRKEHDLRLSFDSTQLLQNQINENIADINEEEYELWIRGYDLEIEKPKGTYVIRFNNDFMGCAKSDGKKLINHVPKERRLKISLPEKID